MKKLFFIPLLIISFFCKAQNSFDHSTSFSTVRVYHEPIIDGELADSVWNHAPIISDFKEAEPNDEGIDADKKTEVKIIYTDEAIFVAAQMFDKPDSVWKELTAFDDIWEKTDLFYICFDTYNDDQNAFCFGVSSRGVKEDGKFSGGNNYDISSNPAWEVKVKMNNDGWAAEYRIPLSAIRFAKTDMQTWGLNCIRKVRRTRQMFTCPYFDQKNSSIVGQYANLTGINNIEPPLRLSFTPYISGYAQNYSDKQNGINSPSKFLKGGMDVKWGINESYTLDMTLIPDFGQVKSDAIIYNLSPFETQYDENRPFFTEGAELFSNQDLFYSRRIGGLSDYYFTKGDQNVSLNSFPSNTQLLNATKISGRSKNNVALGFLNAVTGNTYASATDAEGNDVQTLVDPLTNFNVFSLSKVLKNSSTVRFYNTNVTRDRKGRDADVADLSLALKNKKQTYVLYAQYSESMLFNKDSLPLQTGSRIFLGMDKLQGNLLYGYYHMNTGKTFESNDLGYQTNYDEGYDGMHIDYNWYEPKGKLISYYLSGGADYTYISSTGNFEQVTLKSFVDLNWKNYLATMAYLNCTPFGGNDYYEPRVPGRFYSTPMIVETGIPISTDYRKHLALDLKLKYGKYMKDGRHEYGFVFNPRIKIGNRFLLRYNLDEKWSFNDEGYVDVDSASQIIFGVRTVFNMTNSMFSSYILRPNMNLQLSARHYWSRGQYSSYHILQDDGHLAAANYGYNTSADFNFNAFTIDFGFTWQFLPGSEMSIVYKNSIYGLSDELKSNYNADVEQTFSMPQTNSLSVKILYYLDSEKLGQKKK